MAACSSTWGKAARWGGLMGQPVSPLGRTPTPDGPHRSAECTSVCGPISRTWHALADFTRAGSSILDYWPYATSLADAGDLGHRSLSGHKA